MQELIENLYANSSDIESLRENKPAIEKVISLLDVGELRVCEKTNGEWVVHDWVKQAILLYFKLMPMKTGSLGELKYFDKIPLKTNYEALNVRCVPPATARFGSFMEPGVVLMPSYVNIGAYVGAGSMVDTWATVGSCAQVGSGVHLSGGVGLGGVLEPPSASPVIVEDGAFLGSRCIVVEGVRIGEEAVLSSNSTITQSTPIVDIRSGEKVITKGSIPARAVVIPGTLEKEMNGVQVHTACVYIIGERKASTDRKTSLNSVLREFSLSV